MSPGGVGTCARISQEQGGGCFARKKTGEGGREKGVSFLFSFRRGTCVISGNGG